MKEEIESIENLQMMSEDFMKLKANLDRLEPFYLRVLRTLNLNSLYTKIRKKWALKKYNKEVIGVLKDEIVLEATSIAERPEKVQVGANSFKRV